MSFFICRPALWLPIVTLVLALGVGCSGPVENVPLPDADRPEGNEQVGPDEVLLKISGTETAEQRKAIGESLKQKTDTPGSHGMRTNWSSGGPLTIRLSPVSDPQAFADRVDFGTVDKIEGRTLHITYDPAATP